MNGKIEYGFGKEYLSKWTIKEALREVFQNYIDYGEYTINTRVVKDNPDFVNIRVSNSYIPNKLEFLRIGNSDKNGNSDAIGHHGEGLKMAFLIFLREGLYFKILSNGLAISATWSNDELVGETLRIQYVETHISNKEFITIFECPKDIYESFIEDIISDKDIKHSSAYGDIVDKPKGNIYSGNLYVCNIEELSYAYNIRPGYLPLDRDRCVPNDWDIKYYTSKIIESFNLVSSHKTPLDAPSLLTKQLEGKDYQYTRELPIGIINQFSRKRVGNSNVYINKTDNEIINNRNIIDILDKHPKFKKAIKLSTRLKFKYKLEATKRKSLKTLIKEFKANHCKSEEMIEDINVILKRLL